MVHGTSMGIPSPFPEIDRAVDDVVRHCLDDGRAGSLVTVEGVATSGKSTVLSRFAAIARERAQSPVVELRVPRSMRGESGAEEAGGLYYGVSEDAGPVLLAMAAAQLATFDREPLQRVHALESWTRVADAVRDALHRYGAIVIIDDVPLGLVDPSFDDFFAQRSHDALALLLAEGTTRVVTRTGPSALPAENVVLVRSSSSASEMLEPSRWNGLGESARALRDGVTAHALDALSPLELRLGVGLVAAGGAPSDVPRLRSRRLVHALFGKLGAQGIALRAVVARLALERGPLDDGLLALAGAGELDHATRGLLENAILYEENGRRVLHETFAKTAALDGWLAVSSRSTAHRALAEHHRAAFEEATQSDDVTHALAHEVEAFHHYTQVGDVSGLDRVRAFFTEQLDAFGRALSLARRYDDAVMVYERALDRDEGDWYAHHYLAYNLDVCGRDAARVEAHYQRALELNDRHVWHHGRLACFYVTRGRMTRSREAWNAALSTFGFRGQDDERLYTELHRPFARILLHRGELEFAKEVLDDVPIVLRRTLPWWSALSALHRWLEEAERDETVFPRDVAPEDRWEGPHLVGPEDRNTVKSWMPGRVTHVDAKQITIRVGKGPNEFAWFRRPSAEVRRQWKGPKSSIAAGTLVEIVNWGNVREILVHAPTPADPLLSRPYPRSDRYLRAARRDGAP